MNETQILILLSVDERKKLREMAAMIGRSIGCVQQHLAALEASGYIQNTFGPNGGGLAAGRFLTDLAIQQLKNAGYKNLKGKQ